MVRRRELKPSALVHRGRRALVTLLLPWVAPFELSVDERFDLLDNPRRRFIIRYLADRFPGGVPRGDLIDALVELEEASVEQDDRGGLRNAIFVSLYQIHIPKLEAAAVVDVDDEEVITLTPAGLHLVPYMTEPTAAERTARRMATIAIVGAIVLALWFANAPIVGELPAPWVVAAIVIVLMAASLWACRETLQQYRVP